MKRRDRLSSMGETEREVKREGEGQRWDREVEKERKVGEWGRDRERGRVKWGDREREGEKVEGGREQQKWSISVVFPLGSVGSVLRRCRGGGGAAAGGGADGRCSSWLTVQPHRAARRSGVSNGIITQWLSAPSRRRRRRRSSGSVRCSCRRSSLLSGCCDTFLPVKYDEMAAEEEGECSGFWAPSYRVQSCVGMCRVADRLRPDQQGCLNSHGHFVIPDNPLIAPLIHKDAAASCQCGLSED